MNYVKVFIVTYLVWNILWVSVMLVSLGWGEVGKILTFLATDYHMMLVDLLLCGCATYIYSMKNWIITIKR